jgi:chromosome segregation ATPase
MIYNSRVLSTEMAGLYRKALKIRRRARNREAQGPPGQTDGGLNEEERREIEAQIEELFTDRRLVPAESLSRSELKSGALFPVLVNLGVLALLAAGIWFLVIPSWRNETGALETGEGFATTEGFIVERVREQARAELTEREQRIAEIRRQLEALREQQSAAPGAPEERGERAEALQEELQRLLSEMEGLRAQAEEESDAATSAFEERLQNLQQRQEQEQFVLNQLGFTYEAVDRHLSAGDSGAAMEELDRADQFLADYSVDGSGLFGNAVRILQQGNAALREALQLFEEASEVDPQEAERLAAERAEAREARAQLQAQLEAARQEAAQTEAQLRSELAETRSALATAQAALEEARATGADGGEVSARELAAREEEIATLRSRVSSLENNLERSSARVALLESRIDRRNSSIASLQSEVQEQLSSVRSALSREVADTAGPDREEVEQLLETKTLIREVLISEPVRREHPELYEEMELYLDALGNRRQGAGETQGLYAAVVALQELMEGIDIDPATRVSPRANKEELREALATELFSLVEGVLREAR